MKALRLFVFGLMFITSTQAQVSINVNFGTPPVWAPAEPVATQYYYLPDIDAYYDVPAQHFIYVKKGVWVRTERLPARYSTYNLSSGRVVYLTDYKGSKPYSCHKNHKLKYKGKKYYSNHEDSNNEKHDNGKHKGHKNKH